MLNIVKRNIWIFIGVVIIILIPSTSYSENTFYFSDVPDNHWAKEYIYNLWDLGIIKGNLNEANELVFGINNKVTRAEFLAMAVRLIDKDLLSSEEIRFVDVREEDWFYEVVKVGVQKGIIIQSEEEYPNMEFNPNQFITRLEMAKIIVRAMNYDNLGRILHDTKVFDDIYKDNGYIKICKDLGIMKGKYDSEGKLVFGPNNEALRTEAAAIISRVHSILDNKLETVHGFYAISSYSQIEKIKGFNSIGFGWSGLYYDRNLKKVVVSTRKGEQDYYLPEGFIEPMKIAERNKLKTYLMVYGSNSKILVKDREIGLLDYLLENKENQREIIETLTNNPLGNDGNLQFHGVIIDFEGLKDRSGTKEYYTDFLRSIKEELTNKNMDLIVCLHPIRLGRSYFDGYDYKEIGEIADKIILMAHDYNPSSINDLYIRYFQGQFPLAPINDVYEAIINTVERGVPREKVLLQISLNKESWSLKEMEKERIWRNNYISYSEISKLLKSSNDIISGYDENYEAPYILIKDKEGDYKRIIWYEDSRSIKAKIKLAKDFGLDGISIWRLGLIGDSSHDLNNNYNLDTWSVLKDIIDSQK